MSGFGFPGPPLLLAVFRRGDVHRELLFRATSRLSLFASVIGASFRVSGVWQRRSEGPSPIPERNVGISALIALFPAAVCLPNTESPEL